MIERRAGRKVKGENKDERKWGKGEGGGDQEQEEIEVEMKTGSNEGVTRDDANPARCCRA